MSTLNDARSHAQPHVPVYALRSLGSWSNVIRVGFHCDRWYAAVGRDMQSGWIATGKTLKALFEKLASDVSDGCFALDPRLTTADLGLVLLPPDAEDDDTTS